MADTHYVSSFDLAVIDLGLGDFASAFHHLELACQQQVFRIIEITMPMWDGVHSDRAGKISCDAAAFRSSPNLLSRKVFVTSHAGMCDPD